MRQTSVYMHFVVAPALLEQGMHTFKARLFIAQAFREWQTQSPICSSAQYLEQGIYTSPCSIVGTGYEVHTRLSTKVFNPVTLSLVCLSAQAFRTRHTCVSVIF